MGDIDAIASTQRRRVLAVVRTFPELTGTELLAVTDSAYVRSWLSTVLRLPRECHQARVEDGRYYAT
ncbi:hypothetical protein [Streptomyces fulvoviolaceus]|uniref:hypothetical protein n=1 Tax=Streptomyces fulvoviolaceus TaxID=285535 RepID=UPI0004C7D2C7|nr:hypothetical protein [Streptomyces fulvoviolaceus]MCT9078570.1 hypothetical protein [Streptomyces fulvoviolaceus]